jgi:hypothetical protein
MKQHLWTFVAGGVILLAVVIGLVFGIATRGNWEDRGLMQTAEGKLYWWTAGNLPLVVWFHPDLPDEVLDAYRGAYSFVNANAGKQLFDQGTRMPDGFLAKWMSEGELLIAPADAVEVESSRDTHGLTSLTVIHTGEIKRAVITLPAVDKSKVYHVVLHELLHVLGFEHDEDKRSIMYPKVQLKDQVLTEPDKVLLRSIGK